MWRENILNQLQKRNNSQTRCFNDLITFHNRLFDNANALRAENCQSSIQNGNNDGNSGPSVCSECRVHEKRLQALEQKLLTQQVELTELHKRKGENAQRIIDLSTELLEKDKEIAALNNSLSENQVLITSLRTEIELLHKNHEELKKLYQHVRDENQAQHLQVTLLEEEKRKVMDENIQLVQRLVKYKLKDADKMNEENENFLKKRQAKIQKELEEAAKETGNLSPEKLKEEIYCPASSLPVKASIKFDAHEGEVSAVKWSPDGRLLATGGFDKKVKLWNISNGQADHKFNLPSSLGGIMSIDIDKHETLCIAASTDNSALIWSLKDRQLKQIISSHSKKVMAAKFFNDSRNAVTGSFDGTIKIWDVVERKQIDSNYFGSCCHDLVTWDDSNTTIISCFANKKIYFWDMRTNSTTYYDNIQDKITSLDISRDGNLLLACVRDNTLQLLDLRMFKTVIETFTSDGFKVSCYWTRATISPDGQYVSSGSINGNVFVWNVKPNALKIVLKEHMSPVIATSWHPYGSHLATVDKTNKAIVWSSI